MKMQHRQCKSGFKNVVQRDVMITFPNEEMHSRTYKLGPDIKYFISGLDDGIENIPAKPAYDSYLGGAA